MKKLILTLLSAFVVLTAVFAICSCEKEKQSVAAPVVLTSKGLTVIGDTLTGRVPHSAESFNFGQDITISNGESWSLSTDARGEQAVPEKTVLLSEGENRFYIHVEKSDKTTKTYTVDIYRNHMYTVSFDLTHGNGQLAIEDQHVEEGSFAIRPSDPIIEGYSFTGWSYDFENPITANVNVTASWVFKGNASYKVEYYLSNLDDDGFTLDHTDILEAPINKVVDAEIKQIDNFVYFESKSVVSGEVLEDGSLVLKVYYGRKTILLWNDRSGCGYVTNPGSYKYGATVTSTAVPKLGYDFIGWYSDSKLLCTDITYTFTAEVDVIGRFEKKSEMEGFLFESDYTTCTIITTHTRDQETIIIPDCVTNIGKEAFFQNTRLTEVVFGSGLKRIEEGAFNYCIMLRSLVLPDSVEVIERSAFLTCINLESVKLGSGIKSIGEGAFAYCEKLQSVEIPPGLKFVHRYAFEGCISLTSIVIPESVKYLYSYAFSGCNNLKIYCEAESKPSTWSDDWNYHSRPVEWGYKG